MLLLFVSNQIIIQYDIKFGNSGSQKSYATELHWDERRGREGWILMILTRKPFCTYFRWGRGDKFTSSSLYGVKYPESRQKVGVISYHKLIFATLIR